MSEGTALAGCDFSSAPSKRKPIVLAFGRLVQERVVLDRLERLHTLPQFGAWLAAPGPWIGGFDFPFGLPREHIRARFAAFCDARPAGQKFAHRAFDRLAGSSPSMKWVNPPVAWMLHAALPLVLEAGVDIPGLHAGDPTRVALEAYPGLLARELIGRRSYKNDDPAKHTPERLIARKDIVTALEAGTTRLALRLKLSHAQRDALAEDASGDSLDAVLCLVQAGWAARQGPPRWGLPAALDPLEGWIVSA